MKILITGGDGYIGRNLARLLRMNIRYEVIAPNHKELDILNLESLKNIDLSSFHVIIHTASKGGKRTIYDPEDIIRQNITMFDNLVSLIPNSTKLIVIGSGAEFDRRNDINHAQEKTICNEYPIDPYGLSKNIITRKIRSLGQNNIYNLRLFGCFNYDEEPTRFIKNSIMNIKNNNPIEIHQNKRMDFFYLDDMIRIIDDIINYCPCLFDVNLVYKEKFDLLNIACLIYSACNIQNGIIKINNPILGNSYTGSSELLYKHFNSTCLFKNLEVGIKETCNKLLN